MNARKIATTWGPRLVGFALGLLLAVLVTQEVRAEAGDCNSYGIYIGADHKEAHDHFISSVRGWGVDKIETDENGITTVTYDQAFRNNLHGLVTIMGANGSVIGVYTLIGTEEGNDVGLKEMAKIMANNVAKESVVCGAEVSKFTVDGRDGYYAERSNGTATLYRIQHEDGVVAISWTFGPAEVISSMLMEITK